jgi:hypothetical protein
VKIIVSFLFSFNIIDLYEYKGRKPKNLNVVDVLTV